MIAAGVGYRESLEGDEGFEAEISAIGAKFVTITVYGDSSRITIYSKKSLSRLNIDRANKK